MIGWLWWMTAAALAAQSGEPQPSFCQRLAAASGMNPVKPVNGQPAWEVNTLSGLGPMLFGGTSVMSMGVDPVGDADAAEFRRLQNACDTTVKGAVCVIDGPVEFHVGVKGHIVKVAAMAGEHAEVRIRSTRIRCENRTG